MSSVNPRDLRPQLGAPPDFVPPTAEEFRIEGARALLHARRDLPLVRVQLVFEGGAASDPEDRAGLADLTATLLREGAGDRDAVAFATALDRLGASFSAAASADATAVQISVLKQHLPAALALVADAVVRPRFEASAFARVKTQTAGCIRQRDDQAGPAAAIAAARALFGESHPLGRPTDGRTETVARIGLADVRGRWAVACAEPAVVLATGDVDRHELTAMVGPILAARRARADGLATKLPRPPISAPERAAGLRFVFVDRPDSPQSVIQFGWPGPGYTAPERLPFAIAVTILGGSFTSRLNDNLREKRGFTYGARARGDYYRGRAGDRDAGFGVVGASASVQAEVTGAATREFFAEFERMRAGDLRDEETAKAKATIRNARVAACETIDGLMGDLALIAAFDLPPDRNARDLARLAATTTADANAAARRHLVPDGGVLAIVGDRKSVLPQLVGLGLPDPEFRSEN